MDVWQQSEENKIQDKHMQTKTINYIKEMRQIFLKRDLRKSYGQLASYLL